MNKAHQVLLADPDYRRSTERYAGLFTRASGDAPVIVEAMSKELRELQAGHPSQSKTNTTPSTI